MKNKAVLLGACWLSLIFGLCPLAYASDRFETVRQKNYSAYEIKLIGDTKAFKAQLTHKQIQPGIKLYKLTLSAPKVSELPELKLAWRVPISDISTQWTSNSRNQKYIFPNWSSHSTITSRATNHAPVLTLLSNTDQNKMTFAVDDALNTITLAAGVKEEDAHFDCEVRLFTERQPAVKEFSIQLRIDTREIPFYRSLADVADWWAAMPQYKPLKVPEHARLPMYSSWYSFHQNLKVDEVMQQVKLAKALGYESIIIDDGWQTLDNSRGYSYTGDWEPERIGDMKGFVKQVHDAGMKFILWYSVPDIGDKSKNYQRFKDKYLAYLGGEWGGSYTLDPRYPDVREFLIKTYETAVDEWGLDGFKLDFVDQFIAKEDTNLTATQGRDYASVNEATDRLLTDVMKRLKAKSPDVLIEFRQAYIGPLMRKYGNMFRAGDVPEAYEFNRVRTVDVRLLAGNTPVHSDMLMWHANEPVESAALQLLNVLFSVPQLSVRLDRLPEKHISMVRFWTQYWRDNRDVLLDGELQPQIPSLNYPVVKAKAGDKEIVAVYRDMVVDIDSSSEEIDIINAHLQADVVLRFDRKGKYHYTVVDTLGKPLTNGKLNVKKGLKQMEVPAAGFIKLKKI